MSNVSGPIPVLNLPAAPLDTSDQAAVNTWVVGVVRAINDWANVLQEKLKEMESLSVDGQGLNLTIWPANAILIKRDGVAALFDGEPNVGTPGVGVQGWYAWSASANLWVKV